jgi:hypothetical protein
MYVQRKGTRKDPSGGKPIRESYREHFSRAVDDEDVGLGDILKRATSAIGIKPCGGCERRAAALNRWLVFSGRRLKG